MSSSFNADTNLSYYENPAMSVGSGPIGIDASSISEVTQECRTNTSAAPGAAGEPMQYNGQEVTFDLNVPTSSRVLFDKSYIKVEGFACDMAVGIATPVKPAVSIPWNTIAALVETAQIQLNSQAQTTEKIDVNLGHSSMVKMLTRYSKRALEEMDDALFTPCIEEVRDFRGGVGLPLLSTVSQLRRTNQLINGAAAVRTHAKNIYLCDLFDSLLVPAAYYLQKFMLKLKFKDANAILFGDSNYMALQMPPQLMSTQKYFITRVTLMLTMVKLTENQLVAERDKILKGNSVLREAFWTYDAVTKSHSASAGYQDSNIKNMQASILMFPSTMSPDTGAAGGGCNPYQYCYASTGGGIGGISSYLMKYDGINSPDSPMAIANTSYELNTDVYAQYRLICKKMSDREITPALTFVSMANKNMLPADYTPYLLLCSQFYPQTSYAHKLMAGADHVVSTQGSGTCTAIIVRLRVGFLEIRGDGSVAVIN
jgi:hypothetical protein